MAASSSRSSTNHNTDLLFFNQSQCKRISTKLLAFLCHDFATLRCITLLWSAALLLLLAFLLGVARVFLFIFIMAYVASSCFHLFIYCSLRLRCFLCQFVPLCVAHAYLQCDCLHSCRRNSKMRKNNFSHAHKCKYAAYSCACGGRCLYMRLCALFVLRTRAFWRTQVP